MGHERHLGRGQGCVDTPGFGGRDVDASPVERERQARVILGDSERQVAEKFGEAAKTYVNDPIASHLRTMNMLYEGLKANSTIVIVASTAVESMQLGGLAGMTALTMGLSQERVSKEKKSELESNNDANKITSA